MKRGERAAWAVQRMFRRWSVFILINLVAFTWLAFGNNDARTWWNFAWSALAVDVEFITALALVSMAVNDHARLERMERMEEHMEKILAHLEADEASNVLRNCVECSQVNQERKDAQ